MWRHHRAESTNSIVTLLPPRIRNTILAPMSRGDRRKMQVNNHQKNQRMELGTTFKSARRKVEVTVRTERNSNVSTARAAVLVVGSGCMVVFLWWCSCGGGALPHKTLLSISHCVVPCAVVNAVCREMSCLHSIFASLCEHFLLM